jgi:hypothetical protein
MAYSFQTGGYAFAPVLAKVDEQSLAGLKPISFSGGGQSPVQFRPTAGINVPSSRPELIGQGIASGLGSIAQGIQAAFKSKQDKEETLRKEGREERLLSEKYDREEKMRENRVQDEAALARFKASLPKQYQPNGSMAPNYDSEGEAGDYGTSAMSSAPVPTAYPKAERYDRDFSPIKGGSFESINLPEEDTTGDVFRLDNGSSPLSSITAPVDQSAAPSPRGEEALRALSSIDWSKVKGGLVASTEAFPEPTEIPAQAPDWLRKPKAVTAPLSTLGGFSDQALENTDKALADIQLAYAEQPAVAPKATSGVPRAGFKSYAEAQRYIDSQADNPNWYAESAPKPDKFGNFVIPWKQHDPAAKAAREEAQKTREETSKTQQGLKEQNILNREAVMFQSHPAVKAFTAPNGMQQSFTRFVKDYDAIIKNPEGAGISDVGLLDMFARAEGGGRVTEGQANLVLGSMGIVDKAKTLGMRLEGGDRLSQNQRDQMLRVIAEDNDAQAKIANQAVQMTRAKLIKQGVKDEDSLPQPYIVPKTKFQVLEEINELKTQALKLNAERQRAFASGDKSTSEKLKKQIEEIGKNAVELRRKIDNSKSSIINLEEIETTPQGWTGGAATTLIQQQ